MTASSRWRQAPVHDAGWPGATEGFSAAAVANEFISLAQAENRPKSMLELMKLVYLAHGWHLAIVGTPLVCEPVEAWRYGPVFRTLYSALRGWGSEAVDEPIQVSYGAAHDHWTVAKQPSLGHGPNAQIARTVIQQVWDSYKRFSGGQLITLTHDDGGPWNPEVAASGSAEITESEIKAHFKKLAELAESEAPVT